MVESVNRHFRTWELFENCRKYDVKNLEDLEELLAAIDRILVALQDGDECGDVKGQHLGFTVKEKLPEEYVREYKLWLHEQRNEDSFEKLVEGIDTRV